MIAFAQPTPARTVNAFVVQFFAHAPHSMQKSGFAIRALWLSIWNTACGHTTAHIPQPPQRDESIFKVETFFK